MRRERQREGADPGERAQRHTNSGVLRLAGYGFRHDVSPRRPPAGPEHGPAPRGRRARARDGCGVHDAGARARPGHRPGRGHHPAAGGGAGGLLRPAARLDPMWGVRVCGPAGAHRLRQPVRRRHPPQGAQGASGQLGQEDRLARRQSWRPGRVRGASTPSRPTSSSGALCARPSTSSASTRGGSASRLRSTASSDGALDDFLGDGPDPGRRAPRSRTSSRPPAPWRRAARRTTASCSPHVSTEDAAKDMDVLRAALGDSQLNYLGKSYGTFLGSTYAGLFPERVGRFVLDGVVPPDLTSARAGRGPGQGASSWPPAPTSRTACIEGDCPLGGSVDEGMAWIRAFLKGLDAQPDPDAATRRSRSSPRRGPRSGSPPRCTTRARGASSPTRCVRRKARQRRLPHGTGEHLRGPGPGWWIHRQHHGGHLCGQLPRPAGQSRPRHVRGLPEDVLEGRADLGPVPRVGVHALRRLAGQGPTIRPHKISAEGSDPIVVVGTTRDPATIYEWSKRLRDQLANAVLVSLDGDGHTAYSQRQPVRRPRHRRVLRAGTRAQGRTDVLNEEPPRPDDLPEHAR